MKIVIEESFPGELDGLTDIQKAQKLDEVHHKTAEALGVQRGGEMQLILDLAQELGDAYEERRLKFLADFAEIALEDDEAP